MDNLQIGAEHEAAHVVLYLELGYPIYSVRLEENGTGLTRSRAEDFAIDAFDHAAIYMAGPVVEDRYKRIPLDERLTASQQRVQELREASSGESRHKFEEVPGSDADAPYDVEWWRENGRAFTIDVLRESDTDTDHVDPDLVRVGYRWAEEVLQLRAHDHALIASALLDRRYLSSEDIYALPLRHLPKEPWK